MDVTVTEVPGMLARLVFTHDGLKSCLSFCWLAQC